jgi:glycine hydroxymethyltransferase
MIMNYLPQTDPQTAKLIKQEALRQSEKLNMIPSENIASKAVHEAVGSVFMHKYAEGQVKARYYEGNDFADGIEQLAKDRLAKAFSLPSNWRVIVQALSGANANLGVYVGLLEPGDKILSMYLPDGGHLSHGWSFEPQQSRTKQQINSMTYKGGSRKVSFVSKVFNVIQYRTNQETEIFDYDFLAELILKEKPKMVVTGGTAYPREIDYAKVAAAAKKVGALYLADVAHEAGLIAGGANKNPFEHADVVTFTTHKTFRGPRGAVILCKEEHEEAIQRGLFPGLQGGPHLDNIAGIAVAAQEASTKSFTTYSHQVVKNAQYLAKQLQKRGYYVVSGGTDKHLILLNIRKSQKYIVSPKQLARALDYAGIVLNYNTTPWEQGSPLNPSGIRLGTPILTSRGMKEKEMEFVAQVFDEVNQYLAKYKGLKYAEFDAKVKKDAFLKSKAHEVKSLCKQFPIPKAY